MPHKKVLVIGDPHVKASNLPDIDLFMERLTSEVLLQEGFDGIVVLGDCLHDHERVHTTPMNRAIQMFCELAKHAPVWVLVGNHDLVNNQQFLTENHWMAGLKHLPGVVIVDTVIHVPELNAVMTPYVPNGRMEEALDTLDGPDDHSVLFAHQEFLGCKMGAFESETGDEYPPGAVPVISGHIHSNQQPHPNVYYPGSMLQHAYGESTRNIVAIATIPDSLEDSSIMIGDTIVPTTVHVREVDLRLPRKLTIYTDIDELQGCVHRVPEDGSHTRLVVEGTADDFKVLRRGKLYKELRKRGVKIVLKSRVLNTPQTHASADDFVTILEGLCTTTGTSELLQSVLRETMQLQ